MAPPKGDWISLGDAVAIAGCTQGYLRRLLRDGRLEGWKAGPRAWMIQRADAVALAATLTWRSTGQQTGRSRRGKKPTRG